jgi:hypothetical protein
MSKSSQDTEQQLSQLLQAVMMTLYQYGVKTVSVGAMMRLAGVPNHVAKRHDDEYVEIDPSQATDFGQIWRGDHRAPDGTYYH